MSRSVLCATLLLLAPLAGGTDVAAADTTAVEVKILDVTLDGQETDLWCWATSGEMIMAFFGHQVSQCAQANERYGDKAGVDCCDPATMKTDAGRSACIKGGWPQFDDWGFESENTKHACADEDHCPLSWEQLREQIDQGSPVAFSWRYSGGGGHMLVAHGYVFIPPDGRYVAINNPWPPNNGDSELITYDYYVSGPYQHWRDYYDVRPAPDAGADDKSGEGK